ncbi:MAG: ATP-binding protein [Paracoccaceae bacterium]
MLAKRHADALQSMETAVEVRISIDTNLLAVRMSLQRLLSSTQFAKLTDDSKSTVEIVLAEALNNVVEHAQTQPGDCVNLIAVCRLDTLKFTISDNGLPMPGSRLPSGSLQSLTSLPEGGFGWFLIRRLSHSVTYRRVKGCNMLSFCVAVDYVS